MLLKLSSIGAIVVMIVPVQSVPFISKAVSLNPAQTFELGVVPGVLDTTLSDKV
jgi:hypothetical protein